MKQPICVADPAMSEERVDLARATATLPHVLVYDNSDLARPFRKVAEFEHGAVLSLAPPLPAWLEPIVAAAQAERASP